MLVYRVERKTDGTGLYRGSEHANDYLQDTNGRHPMPYRDSRLMDALGKEDYVGKHFAFTSLDQLKMWIHNKDDRQAIAADGLHIVVFSAKEAWAGDTQAVFVRSSAQALENIELTDL